MSGRKHGNHTLSYLKLLSCLSEKDKENGDGVS